MMVQAPRRILVVDDEQHQLDTVCRGMVLYGYRCHGVLSVNAALDALANDGGDRYALVFTDLTMAGRSGLELIERVQERWPTLPFVVATGLAVSAELATLRARNIPLLKKPYDPDALDAVIREVLHL
jgi:DNA-binding NtrC family response regulator